MTSRRETLKKLQQERLRLRTAERSNAAAAAHAADRESLLSAGDGKSYGRETELTRDMTTQQLVERGNEEIKAQDSILDNMSKRLDNLKNMGKAIGDESDLHMVRGGDGSAFPLLLSAHCSFIQTPFLPFLLTLTLLALLPCLTPSLLSPLPPLQTLLDNLEKGVDKANVNLDKETERARRITEETKTCWLYVTICILLLVLVALAAVRWA